MVTATVGLNGCFQKQWLFPMFINIKQTSTIGVLTSWLWLTILAEKVLPVDLRQIPQLGIY